METLCIVCTVDPTFTTNAENKICPLTIAIFLKYNNGTAIAPLTTSVRLLHSIHSLSLNLPFVFQIVTDLRRESCLFFPPPWSQLIHVKVFSREDIDVKWRDTDLICLLSFLRTCLLSSSQTLWWRPWLRTSLRNWPRSKAVRVPCRCVLSPRWSASCKLLRTRYPLVSVL